MDSFDVFGDIDNTDIMPIIALGAVQEAQSKVPRSTGLLGAAYLEELLNRGNEKRIYSVPRMNRIKNLKYLSISIKTKATLLTEKHLVRPFLLDIGPFVLVFGPNDVLRMRALICLSYC
jgi:hypothetical protein